MEITEKITVINQLGLHLRACAVLVETTSKFKCRIYVENENGRVNAKSLINLMTLAAAFGQELTLNFDGDDAENALAAIKTLFLNKFGEKE